MIIKEAINLALNSDQTYRQSANDGYKLQYTT